MRVYRTEPFVITVHTHTRLLRTVLLNCDVECIGRAQNTFITLARKESSELQRWKVEGHNRCIQEEINTPTWSSKTTVLSCASNEEWSPNLSPSSIHKLNIKSIQMWSSLKLRLRQQCRHEVEKQIVLPVLSLASCYNECRYVQSASRLHIAANLECLRWVVTPRMPTTPLQLRYIRVRVLHLLRCFTHTKK